MTVSSLPDDARENMPEKRKRQSRWMLALTLGALLLFLAFRGVDWGVMLDTLRSGRVELLALAFGVVTVSYFLRGQRWRVLLSAERVLHPITVFWGTCAGYLGNSFLPARAGELIRAALIAQKANISVSFTLATALTERIIDVPVLVILGLIALPAVDGIPEWLGGAVRAFALVGVAGTLALLIVPRFERQVLALMEKLPLPVALRARLIGFAQKFLQGLRAFQDPVRAVSFLGLTALVWALDVVSAMLIASAFGLTFTPAETILLLAALGLASAAPSTPGYVGIYQFVAVTVLEPFGYSREQALAYIIAFQAMSYLIVLVWGLTGLWRLNQNRVPSPRPVTIDHAP
jgi:glycosyltransferase 2 family protein